jgi:hypothetical protein
VQMIGPVRSIGDETCPTACLEDRIMKDGHRVARRQDEWFLRRADNWKRRTGRRCWRQCHDERLA